MSTDARYEAVNALAHELWLKRGKPLGSPQVDWDEAVRQLTDSYGDSMRVARNPDIAAMDNDSDQRTLPVIDVKEEQDAAFDYAGAKNRKR